MIGSIDDMPYDADLCNRVINDHGIAVAALATRSGYAGASIYRYLAGDKTLPSSVLRAIFELTGDCRILGLISGSVPICITALHSSAQCPACGGQPGTSNVPGQPAAASQPSPAPPTGPCGAGHSPAPQRVPPLNQALAGTLEAIECAAKSGRYMHQIAADGRFDASDLAAADKFERDAGEAQRHLAMSLAAIRAYRERLVAK